MRQGRKVKEGCQPMKWVKQHAVTINRKRAIEVAMGGDEEGAGSEKDVMQGLYSQSQTELYHADPVVDVSFFKSWVAEYSVTVFQGIVPKNDFGNIDLYVPSMLPAGGAYIPCKSSIKQLPLL